MSDLNRFDDIHDLLVRADAPEMHFDLERTLRQGRRVRARRRLAAIGGGLAAVSAVTIAFAALGPLPGDDALPAGRSDSQATGTSSVELLDYRYAVEVKPMTDGRLRVTSYAVDAGKRTRLDTWTARAGALSLAPRDVADGVRFAVAPDSARYFIPLGGADAPMRMPGIGVPIPGTDHQAVAFRGSGVPNEELSGVIWTDDKGAYDVTGRRLPSLIDPMTEEVLVADPEHHLFLRQGPDGFFGGDFAAGSTPWMSGDYDTRANRIQVLGATFAIPTRGSAAQDIAVTWNNGTSTPATVLGTPGGEWTFLHTERTKPEQVPSGEVHPTAVEWTDGSGVRHEEPVKQKVG